MSDVKFVTWDWVVFAAMLIISAGIGLFYAMMELRDSKKATTDEFLMGGHNMNLFPVSVSMLVSFVSAVLMLGNPAEMYMNGTLFVLNIIGITLSIVLTTVLFVPLFYPLRMTSTFEYLELRFNSKAAKYTGTIIFMIQSILYTGIASFAPSTALEAVTGFPTWATIVTLLGVATFYTFLGGLKAVVLTDLFQACVMVAGMTVIVVQGIRLVGGIDEVWAINEQWDRINFWEPNPDPTERHTVWTLVVGGSLLWLSAFGTSQPSVQRYCSLTSLKKARIAVMLNIPTMLILFTLTTLAGITLFAYYAQKGCDPLYDKQISNVNQIIPYFVTEVLGYPGLPGLFLSCLFSGALSTVSSNLNSLSAVAWQDICKPLVGDKVSEKTKTWITKGLVILFGAAGFGVAFLAQSLSGTVLQISYGFNGASAGPLMGLFFLGSLFPWANWIGCVIGGIIGLALPFWIGLGSFMLPKGGGSSLDFPIENCTNFIPPANVTAAAPIELSGLQQFYKMSYLWYTAIGMATAVIVGLTVSLITNPFMKKEPVDPKYLMPLFDRLFCCFPQSVRKPCRCGYEFKDPEELCKEGENKDNNDDTNSCHQGENVISPFEAKNGPCTVVGVSYKKNADEHTFENKCFAEDMLSTTPGS